MVIAAVQQLATALPHIISAADGITMLCNIDNIPVDYHLGTDTIQALRETPDTT
jgi:hypothetical protein